MYGAVTFTSVPGCLKDQSHALGKEGVVSQFGGYFSFPSVCPSLLTIRPLGQGVPFIYLFIIVCFGFLSTARICLWENCIAIRQRILSTKSWTDNTKA